MGCVNIIFKISAIIAIVAISLSYTDLGKHLVKTVHKLTPDWLNPHASKSKTKTAGDSIDVYKVISDEGDRLYSKEELAKFVDDTLYIAILGRVYDVSSARHFYGPGGGYGFFSGKDGTRAYMSGEFNETGLIEDTTGLTLTQMTELENWIKFYDEKYIYKGKLHGLYYDENGKPTEELFKVRENMIKARKVKAAADLERERFPLCNQEWGQQKTARVWCTNKSGGIDRDWVGVPRKYFPPAASQEQCVCVRTTGPPSDNPAANTNVGDLANPHLRLYKGCDSSSPSCAVVD